MKQDKANLYNINFILILKAFLLGAVSTEVVKICLIFIELFKELCISSNNELLSGIVLYIYIFTIVTMTMFLLANKLWFSSDNEKKRHSKIVLVLKSKRIELVFFFILGISTTILFEGYGINVLYSCVELNLIQLTFIIFIPLILFLYISFASIKKEIKKKKINSYFVEDKEIEDPKDDKLGLKEQVENFADKVYDGKSSNSLVFGLEAPWGTGKSSYLNMTTYIWSHDDRYKDNMIIYKFTPLEYEDQDNLLEKFTNGLVKEINKHSFNPDIGFLASKYVRLLKASLSIRGVNVHLPLDNYTYTDTFDKLQNAISIIDKKIVIIVDDLDRLDYDSIIEVLFVIKKSFALKNVSYVLCYDIENIYEQHKVNKELDKIIEFFEKFVNVKFSILLDSTLLLDMFIKDNDKLSNKGEETKLLREKAIEGLKDIFSSKDYHMYLPFVGDARKIKQLINTIYLLDIDATDYKNSDYEKKDLLHLLLIYINYPKMFRRIYHSETYGRIGDFSVRYTENAYKNNPKFDEILNEEKLSPNIKFILKRIFDVTTNEIDKHYSNGLIFSAAINSAVYRNLENYLRLIADRKRPELFSQKRYYDNKKKNIIELNNISDEFKVLPYRIQQGVSTHKEMWSAVVEINNHEVDKSTAYSIIRFAIKSISNYSCISVQNIVEDTRSIMIKNLLWLLNDIGWKDVNKINGNNTKANISEIPDWLFGKKEHKDEGVLESLANNDVMGLYDMMLLNNNIIQEHNSKNPNNIFNVVKSLYNLANNKDEESIFTLDTSLILDYIYNYFTNNYIIEQANIFDKVRGIDDKVLFGRCYDKIKDSIKELNKEIDGTKNFIILTTIKFITGNLKFVKNSNDIVVKITNYLFYFCFNPYKFENGYNNFLDYMLMNFNRNPSNRPFLNINVFTKTDSLRNALIEYWKQHREVIKESKFEDKDNEIYCLVFTYTASYKKDLLEVYKTLDNYLDNQSIDNNQENAGEIVF